MQYSTSQREELRQLREVFANLSNEPGNDVIEGVYEGVGRKFEEALMALEAMGSTILRPISNETKLAFLGMVFDQLSAAAIQDTLIAHSWSVEAALDDLLEMEERV